MDKLSPSWKLHGSTVIVGEKESVTIIVKQGGAGTGGCEDGGGGGEGCDWWVVGRGVGCRCKMCMKCFHKCVPLYAWTRSMHLNEREGEREREGGRERERNSRVSELE